jgi:hypothetical protein
VHLEIRYIALWDTATLRVFPWFNLFRALGRPLREKAGHLDCDHSEYCGAFPHLGREPDADPLVCVDLLVWLDYSPEVPVVLCAGSRAHP